jgi:SH3 domain-containing YSC84-like protein 1
MRFKWPHAHAVVVVVTALVLLVGESFAQDITSDKSSSDVLKRIHLAATVLKEVMSEPDRGIPRRTLGSAKCVAVAPSTTSGAFILGAHAAKGIAICRTGSGWSPPVPFTLSAGGFGSSIGGQAIDIILLAMNEKGVGDLLSTQLKLGADVSVAAGPVGRQAEGTTEWKRSEFLVYTRSRGLFAGVSLEGAIVRQDKEGTQALYGTFVPSADILTGKIAAPSGTQEFVSTVREYADAKEGDHTGRPSHQTFTEPVWNVWTEDTRIASPAFKPVKMQPGHSYLLVIDLAAVEYEKYAPEAYSHGVSKAFDDWLSRNTQDQTSVKVLAIPDDRFFERMADSERVRELPIDLKKLRQTQSQGFELTGSPFDYLASHSGNAPFTFGKTAFRIETKAKAVGTGSIAFSFWVDGKPIDELSYAVCIVAKPEDPCVHTAPTHDSLYGVDATSHNSIPDAALHLIELDSQNLVGVFRCNSCGWGANEFKTWKLGRGAGWFQQQFVQTVLPGIKLAANGPDPDSDPAFNERIFNTAGEALYGLIFHSEDGSPPDAEKTFSDFVADKTAHEQPGAVVPSLFVRLLPQQPDQGFFIPMGLARVKVAANRKEFLGFHFRIQSPLELQDYSPQTTCVDKWTLLVPPPNLVGNPLLAARAAFDGWISKFQSFRPNASVYDNLDKFRDWLAGDDAVAPGSATVLILSHHENNSLFFDQSVSAIFATNVKRQFAKPSVAIIDACGTANPGAFEFVREFNAHGANAVVASSVEINGRMGGVFLRLLADSLDRNRTDPTYTLDRAVFDSITALRTQPDETGDNPAKMYGPRALLFGLVGNGNMRLCVPGK